MRLRRAPAGPGAAAYRRAGCRGAELRGGRRATARSTWSSAGSIRAGTRSCRLAPCRSRAGACSRARRFTGASARRAISARRRFACTGCAPPTSRRAAVGVAIDRCSRSWPAGSRSSTWPRSSGGFLRPALRRGLRLRRAMIDTSVLGLMWLHERDGGGPRRFADELGQALGLPSHRPHDAVGDALTTAQVFVALATHLDARRPETVGAWWPGSGGWSRCSPTRRASDPRIGSRADGLPRLEHRRRRRPHRAPVDLLPRRPRDRGRGLALPVRAGSQHRQLRPVLHPPRARQLLHALGVLPAGDRRGRAAFEAAFGELAQRFSMEWGSPTRPTAATSR